MFFLARSVFCIGVVVLLTAGESDRIGLGHVLDRGGRTAAQNLGRACAASSPCVEAGLGLLAAVTRPDAASPAPHGSTGRSFDTLTASDLVPAWITPGGRRVAGRPHADGTLAL